MRDILTKNTQNAFTSVKKKNDYKQFFFLKREKQNLIMEILYERYIFQSIISFFSVSMREHDSEK